MHEYNVCTCADMEIYKKQCDAIKKKFDDFVVEDITDVDGTDISIFTKEDKKIKVFNDIAIDAVYVKSTFDLLPYFAK